MSGLWTAACGVWECGDEHEPTFTGGYEGEARKQQGGLINNTAESDWVRQWREEVTGLAVFLLVWLWLVWLWLWWLWLWLLLCGGVICVVARRDIEIWVRQVENNVGQGLKKGETKLLLVLFVVVVGDRAPSTHRTRHSSYVSPLRLCLRLQGLLKSFDNDAECGSLVGVSSSSRS